MKRALVAVVIVGCALSVVGCRSMTGRTLGQQIDDKAIGAQVKTKLIGERFGNMFSTDVDTQLGVVRLGGTVPSQDQKAEAERIASRVTGVKGVSNEIVVVPPPKKTDKAGGDAPAASPAAAKPVLLSGEVTAIDRATGDVTVKTASGDVTLRVPVATAQSLEHGQRLSINAGGSH